jgi:phytoene/squalene synthetase
MNLTQRRLLIERIRAYLRRHDLIQGYLPQLAMQERSSEWWCLIWYCIRQLDTVVDGPIEGPNDGDPLDSIKSSDRDFEQALSLFLNETARLVLRPLLSEMYASTKLERQHFSDGRPQTCAQYLTLVDRKAVIPVHICAKINELDVESEVVKQLVFGVGRAAQLMDDLLDLRADLAQGRLFITSEELELLRLSPDDIFANLDRVAMLRSKWAMGLSWSAYEAANTLQDNRFAVVARSWIEGIWRLVAKGKAVPLDPVMFRRDQEFAHYLGATSLPFDLFPGSELLKYRLVHRLMATFLKYYSVCGYDQARRVYDQIHAPVEPLLELVEARWLPGVQLPTNTHLHHPTREIINLDDNLGLLALSQEMPRIAQKAAADCKESVVRKLEQGDVLGGVAEVMTMSVDFLHAVEQDSLAHTREMVIRWLPHEQWLIRGLVDLGFDCLSIVRDHQNAFQHEVLDRFETKPEKHL